jgi:hypothetical protein
MNQKYVLITVLAVALLCIGPVTVLSQVTVGVKPGQYAEYNVSFTGTPMVGHDATWARMEIAGVEGSALNVTFISRLADGSTENVTENLNFATGRFIDYFVVPAGLNEGDSFYDQTLGENVSIIQTEVRTYAGAQRTVVSGATNETLWYWDQATGALVEAESNYPDFTLHTVIDKTDIWNAQSDLIFGIPPVVLFAILFVVVVIVAFVVNVKVRKRTPRLLPSMQKGLTKAANCPAEL